MVHHRVNGLGVYLKLFEKPWIEWSWSSWVTVETPSPRLTVAYEQTLTILTFYEEMILEKKDELELNVFQDMKPYWTIEYN